MAKIDLEKIILAVFFAVMLFIGPGIIFGHKISHDFPYGYSASDAFQHQIRAEAIKDAGNFRYEASYISRGFENIVGRYPPLIYHIAVIMSYSSGIEVYDSIYFLVAFFAIIAALINYLIIRNFNKTVALLSLPLTLLIFSFPLSAGFMWGHWPSLLAQSFLILFIWSILRINLEKSFIIIASALSAVALTHTSEIVFGVIFLMFLFLIKTVTKSINKDEFKNLIFGMALSLIAASYYLIIFMNTWAKSQAYVFLIQPIWEGNPGFYIAGFGLLLIPIIAGIIFSFFKLKDAAVPMALAYSMLISGFLNYAGFDVRAFQIRFYWPIYLAAVFGLGLYFLIQFLIKKWNGIYISVSFLILVVLIGGIIKLPIIAQTKHRIIPSMPYINQGTSQGIMDKYHWSALKWLSENTELNARIYFFYGDIYSQDALLRNSKRFHAQIDVEDLIKSVNERKIKRKYVTELPGDSGGGPVTRKGLFNFEDAGKGMPTEYFYGHHDICEFSYFVFDKVSQNKVLAQYNLLIASELLKKEHIRKTFENEVVLILKNDKMKADCIEEKNF